DRSTNALLQSDIKAAPAFVAEVERISRWLPARLRPRVMAMRARCLQAAGAYKQAAAAYEQALRIYRKQQDFVNAARVGRALTEVYMYVGAYPDALRHGRAAVRYFRSANLAGD